MNDERLLLRALDLCYFYLKFRPRTKKEIIDYLVKKEKRYKFTKKTIDDALQSLEEQSLINDWKFIEWLVEIKSKRKPKSEFLLKRELLKHGVEKELIEKYFEENKLGEEEAAKKALLSRWERIKNLSKEHRFQKAASFLQRRGFTYEIIKKTITHCETKE